jgi:hypothetical protein
MQDITCQTPLKLFSLEEKSNFFTEKLQRVAVSARQRDKEFSISLDDILLPDYCPVLGIQLDYGWPITNLAAVPSIDRIDNAKGYIPGNVLVISNRANKLKNDATRAELLAMARFWPSFYAGDPAILTNLGTAAPHNAYPSVKLEKHETRKAYWRDYQRKRYEEKRKAAAAKQESGENLVSV